MTHHRTGFPFHPVAGATGTDGHNISWTDGLSTQNIVEFPQHRGRAPCRGGFRRGFLARGAANRKPAAETEPRSEEHTSELQSLMRISYAVFCLKKKHTNNISKP